MGESRSTGSSPVHRNDARRRSPSQADPIGPYLFAMLDAADEALWAEDADGIIVAWNAPAERLFGWTAADVVGCPATMLLPPGTASPDIMGGRDMETVRLHRDGSPIPVSITGSAIPDPRGRRIGTTWRARARHEPTLARRADLFRRLDAVLAEALDPDVVLEALAEVMVPAIADACIAYLPRKNGTIRRVAARHADPAGMEALERFLALPEPTLDDDAGPGLVLRTGMAVLVPDLTPEQLDHLPGGQRIALRALDPSSIAVLPMRARERPVAALALLTSRSSGRELGHSAIGFARRLADRAALTLDNARLFADARAELARRHLAEDALRQRFEHLGVVYHMTEAVGRAGALESIYAEALDSLRRGVHADRAAVLLLDDQQIMRFEAWRGLSDAYRRVVEGHSPWTADDPDPQPIVIANLNETGSLPPAVVRAIREEGIGAVVFIPLVFQQRVLGKFMLYFDTPHTLTNEELALAQTIAANIAFAIVRVRAEQSVRIARDLAEDASRAKSQFLGVMSHELRTPLNAVLGYADLLLMQVRGPLTEGQRQQIERIRASAHHQLDLIEELLTYTRLQAGREEPSIIPTDLRRVVADVVEFVRPEAERKGLSLRVEIPDEPLEIVTDPAKLRQIILNLAANATKFTSVGEVFIGAARVVDGFVVRVRDTGPGIDPDKIDYIFEPFAQASEGRTRASGGTGLGLSIARRFADLLGARIDVHTRPGEGATFILRVPARIATE